MINGFHDEGRLFGLLSEMKEDLARIHGDNRVMVERVDNIKNEVSELLRALHEPPNELIKRVTVIEQENKAQNTALAQLKNPVFVTASTLNMIVAIAGMFLDL